ncbi:GDP-mannose transporter into the lumen of the Golgi [Termitomyces sp. Mi166|nr:GDP-mannose transporter into the lumen of the Golgi [Termitomyces sp. Mi166\
MTTRNKSPEDVAELKKALATKTEEEVQASAVPPILCYCCASILMTVVNKFVVSGVNFSMTFLLLAMQSIVCVLCVLAAKKAKLIQFRPFDVDDAKAWFPISALLVSVIYTGSKSLQFLSIPVYTIFKNLTIILIAYGEVIWFGGRITGLTFVSFILMVISSIIAAWPDIIATMESSVSPANTAASLESFTGAAHELNIGYLWMLVNCLASAGYVLAMRKRIKVTGFSDWDSMFYNNLLCIPVLVICSLLAEDWASESFALNFPQETRVFLLPAIAFSGAAAVGISYTTAWCIRMTSSTTYSMVGALNKLPVAASGMIFFGDPVTPGSVSAVSVGFLAGLIYSVAKNNQKKADQRKEADTILPLASRSQSSKRQ